MGKYRWCADAGGSYRQRLEEIAKDHVVGVGNAFRMRVDVPVEDEDLAVGEDGAQVIVGPAVAQSHFEGRTAEPGHQRGRLVEAVALGGQTAQEAVEAAHRGTS
jgi:hypothetical protein